jgi:hypothetical protein
MAGSAFTAVVHPAPELCAELECLQPDNPFATRQFLAAEETLGSQPWLFGCRSPRKLVFGCFGFLRIGRLNSTLTIPSLPAAEEPFWRGLMEFSSSRKLSFLELNTFASPPVEIPALGEERARKRRYEFIVPLGSADPLGGMNKAHRQSVRKGIQAGLQVRESNDARHIDDHVLLIGSSMQRREARGEDVNHEVTRAGLEPYLRSGFCTLFQALRGDEVLSSMSVAHSAGSGYLHTSGTSPAGMTLGASHFLLYEILKAMQRRGAASFNMGGVPDPESGLAKYKQHFGATYVALERAEFSVQRPLNKAINASVDTLRGLLRRVTVSRRP